MSDHKSTALLEHTERALRGAGSKERALHDQQYLKSALVHLGVSVPALRREAKAFARAQPELTRAELRSFCDAAWATNVYDLRAFAVGVLESFQSLLNERDAAWLRRLVRESKTWALVDWLATKVLGPLVERSPAVARALDRWACDPDFWVRRAALLALHDPILRGAGDFAHFERLSIPMLGEREFFVRKAIGWMLRSASKRRPDLTIAYLERYAAKMAGLTFKEATRHLPASVVTRLHALRVHSRTPSSSAID